MKTAFESGPGPASRREWLRLTTFAALFGGYGGSGHPMQPFQPADAAAPARKPNVLLILSDDQGYGDLGCHGNPVLQTPSLDGLAAQSTEFVRFYVSPVCAPTRASLLTGRYNVRTGVHGVTAGKETMPVDETTVAEAFRAAGYRTALIGKWHLGEAYPNVPHAQGFDTFIGMRNGHWNNYFDAQIEQNGKPYKANGYIADALTDEAIRYTSARRDEPFFLYLSYNTPHTPFQVAERYWKKFTERGMPIELAAIYGMVENLDENVGRLLRHLDESNLGENTIVVFLTDNGPNGERYNAGLRGRKGAVYEGGVRVPFFIRWPGKIESGRKVDRIASHIDVYPTLAEMCGVQRPDGRPLDGRSLWPLLQAPPEREQALREWPDRAVFTHRELEGRETNLYPGAIRTQRYNLVNGAELYDMEKDPGETTNLAASHPELVRELRGRYEDWFHTALAERGFTRFPLPIGYPEENPVNLPATQAYFTGKVRFHGGNGYSHDWLTGWTEEADTVHWEVEVVQQGTYRVTLQYLCPESELDTLVLLEAGGSTASAKVEMPTRMEPLPDFNLVYVKHYVTMEWGELRLGEVQLAQGVSHLRLRCKLNAGNAGLAVKGLILERL